MNCESKQDLRIRIKAQQETIEGLKGELQAKDREIFELHRKMNSP